MKKLFIPIVASLLLIVGCDKIDHPIQGAGETGEPTTELKRRIFV